jgi:pimeloyl-ACP methyl ester carboxylesterase
MTKPSKILPVAGETFAVEGHAAFLIMPQSVEADGKAPWVWYAPTLPGLPGAEEKWMFQQFLEAGIAVAGIDVGESYGSPMGCVLFTALYEHLTHKRGLSQTPCLLARSRGGLMLYNWAVENSSSVACVAGIYPVCNLSSYPGVENACGAYGMTAEQLETQLTEHNPVDRLNSLAKARVPIYHIHGDSDAVVPIEKNSGELAQRYQQLGGEVILNVVKGQGHTMWPGWFACPELVDFTIYHAYGADG